MNVDGLWAWQDGDIPDLGQNPISRCCTSNSTEQHGSATAVVPLLKIANCAILSRLSLCKPSLCVKAHLRHMVHVVGCDLYLLPATIVASKRTADRLLGWQQASETMHESN
jgi:hypothetical protein